MTNRVGEASGPSPGEQSRDRLGATALSLLVLVLALRLAPVWSSEPDLGHGWLVGCFFLWWALERWRERPKTSSNGSQACGWPPAIRWWGAGFSLLVAWFGLVAVLLPVRLLLTPYPYWPGLLWLWSGGLVGLALGGLWLTGGLRWVRHFGFGALLIAVALPWPQAMQRAVFEPTREAITVVAAEALNFAGYPTLVQGTTLQVMGRWVGMEEACAGLRSLQLALALGVMLGEAVGMRWRRRLAAIALAVGVAVGANLGRVLFLSWRAAEGAPAEDPWHDASGYLAYLLLAVVLGAVGWRWRRGGPHGGGPAGHAGRTTLEVAPVAPPDCGEARAPEGLSGPATVGRIPGRRMAQLGWVAAVFACLLTEVGARGWFSGPKEGWQPSWRVLLPDQTPYFGKIPLGSSAREMLQPDHYEGGSWMQRDGLTRVVFYAEWRQGQMASHVPFVHNPTVCFPYAGCRIEQEIGPMEVAVAGRSVVFQGYRFVRAGQRIVVYYTVWDTDRQQPLSDTRPGAGWMEWWRSRWDTVASRRSQIRAQLLTVAVLGDEEQMEWIDAAFLRREIAAVIAPTL